MMKKTSEILQLTNITTGYKSGRNQKIVSQNLQLQIENGAFVALIGKNGCGKSTLLRTIAGLQQPFSGEISISNTKIQQLKSKEKARLLSLVLTDKVDSAYLVVEDIVGIGRYPHTGSMGILTENDKKIVQKSLEKCDLERYAKSNYTELSDGEKQRVMLARALAQDTPLMMLDEPTAHLDLPNRVKLMKMLRDLAKTTHKAILLSTHELDLAMQWCDEIWLMNKNGEITTGTPEDLVLNGAFSEVFSNEDLFFDTPTGTFKIKREPHAYIHLTGDEIAKEWTRRALEREGFALTNSETEIRIEAHNNKWTIMHNGTQTDCVLIKEVINQLKQLNL